MIGYWILAVLVAFIAVVAIRTIRFRPKPQPEVTKEEIAFDRDAAVDSLAQLVRCKTVSYNDHSLEDEGEFQKLISLLPTLYPNVFGTCTFQQLPDRALLLRWPGKQEGDPAVMMAHYDVVPVNEEKWDKPPFAGIIEDGILWGRGTLDTKVTFNGILSAANYLIGQGFQPEKDIYFAFSGGEEINGQGAPNIVAYFNEHGIHPAIVVDEGGAVVENVFPGVKQPCGLIGIAEKGMLNAQYRTVSAGGHASAPKPHTPVGVLAAACKRVEDHPFKAHIEGARMQVVKRIGTYTAHCNRNDLSGIIAQYSHMTTVLYINHFMFRIILCKIPLSNCRYSSYISILIIIDSLCQITIPRFCNQLCNMISINISIYIFNCCHSKIAVLSLICNDLLF